MVQNEDNSRNFTASFGNASSLAHPLTSINETHSDSDSSFSEDSDEESDDDSAETSSIKQVSNFMQQQFPKNEYSFGMNINKDRLPTAQQSKRSRALTNMKMQERKEPEIDDLYTLVHDNEMVKMQLDHESQGFAKHLVNSQNEALTKIYQNYYRHANLETFIDELEHL